MISKALSVLFAGAALASFAGCGADPQGISMEGQTPGSTVAADGQSLSSPTQTPRDEAPGQAQQPLVGAPGFGAVPPGFGGLAPGYGAFGAPGVVVTPQVTPAGPGACVSTPFGYSCRSGSVQGFSGGTINGIPYGGGFAAPAFGGFGY